MIWRIEILFLNLQTEMQKRYEYGNRPELKLHVHSGRFNTTDGHTLLMRRTPDNPYWHLTRNDQQSWHSGSALSGH